MADRITDKQIDGRIEYLNKILKPYDRVLVREQCYGKQNIAIATPEQAESYCFERRLMSGMTKRECYEYLEALNQGMRLINQN